METDRLNVGGRFSGAQSLKDALGLGVVIFVFFASQSWSFVLG